MRSTRGHGGGAAGRPIRSEFQLVAVGGPVPALGLQAERARTARSIGVAPRAVKHTRCRRHDHGPEEWQAGCHARASVRRGLARTRHCGCADPEQHLEQPVEPVQRSVLVDSTPGARSIAAAISPASTRAAVRQGTYQRRHSGSGRGAPSGRDGSSARVRTMSLESAVRGSASTRRRGGKPVYQRDFKLFSEGCARREVTHFRFRATKAVSELVDGTLNTELSRSWDSLLLRPGRDPGHDGRSPLGERRDVPDVWPCGAAFHLDAAHVGMPGEAPPAPVLG